VLSFVAAEMIGWPVIEGSRAGIDYLGGQGFRICIRAARCGLTSAIAGAI